MVAVKVERELLAATPSSGILRGRGREESAGTSKPQVVQNHVYQSAGSQASLTVVGRRVPSHESGSHRSSPAPVRLGSVGAVYYKQIRKSEQKPPLYLRTADLVPQPLTPLRHTAIERDERMHNKKANTREATTRG